MSVEFAKHSRLTKCVVSFFNLVHYYYAKWIPRSLNSLKSCKKSSSDSLEARFPFHASDETTCSTSLATSCSMAATPSDDDDDDIMEAWVL